MTRRPTAGTMTRHEETKMRYDRGPHEWKSKGQQQDDEFKDMVWGVFSTIAVALTVAALAVIVIGWMLR